MGSKGIAGTKAFHASSFSHELRSREGTAANDGEKGRCSGLDQVSYFSFEVLLPLERSLDVIDKLDGNCGDRSRELEQSVGDGLATGHR